MKIRLATSEDAAEILAIYEPYILNSTVTFENETPQPEEFQKRITDSLEKFPWIVAEENKKILGYAYAGPYKARAGYAWSVETSVYVGKEFQGKGIGKALYLKLLELLKAQGVLNIIAGIALPNEASVHLHESLGFERIATYKNIGFKLGRWWDVGYWQLEWPKSASPEKIKPYSA